MTELRTKCSTCKDCGEEIQFMEAPEDRLVFRLFGYEFILRKWKKEPYCLSCETERNDTKLRRIYEDGHNDGYNQACDKYGVG